MIGIIGATGFTGKLIATELKKRKAKFFIAGRNEQSLRTMSQSLEGVPFRVIDVQNSSTFKSLDGCTIIINCAGPFTDLGEPIVQEAIARKAHYLDTTGEQGFIKLVYDKYHDPAKAAGVVLVPACAFEYAIGDAMGSSLCNAFPEATAIEMIYSLEGMYTSPGTRKSIVRAMAATGYFLSNGKLTEQRPVSRKMKLAEKTVSLMSFPAGEVLMLPRHTNVQSISTYLAVEAPPLLLQASATFGRIIMKAAGDFIVKKTTAQTPSVTQRQSTTFLIQATATDGNASHRMTVTGKDPYLLTAIIISDAVVQLLSRSPAKLGAITPAMIGGPELVRKRLEKSDVKWATEELQS